MLRLRCPACSAMARISTPACARRLHEVWRKVWKVTSSSLASWQASHESVPEIVRNVQVLADRKPVVAGRLDALHAAELAHQVGGRSAKCAGRRFSCAEQHVRLFGVELHVAPAQPSSAPRRRPVTMAERIRSGNSAQDCSRRGGHQPRFFLAGQKTHLAGVFGVLRHVVERGHPAARQQALLPGELESSSAWPSGNG